MNCIMFCNNYPNTIFDSSRRACVCRPGTFFINGSCQSCPNNFNFNGVNCVAPFVCPPNSILMSGVCVCMSGYKRQSSNCVPFDGGNDEDSCPDNYYWSNQQKRCLVCIDGCASCSDGRTCRVCSTGFNRNSQGRCAEICGDGVRFILACDDGNRINGDGCSSNCRVESGWTCFGGSPNSRDFCSNSRPTRIALNPTGQTHTEGKVTQNIRASWLPANLTNGTCSDCLDVKVVSGPQPRGINVRYVPGTSYSFSVEFDYGYEPIPDFRYQARINPKLQNSYFQGIDISSVVGSNLSPNLMAVNEEVATLSL
jgi:cysteine-rich repeat protein